MRYYNRYQEFFVNGQQTIVPFVKLPSKPTDKRYIYRVGVSRLDINSLQDYKKALDTHFFYYGR